MPFDDLVGDAHLPVSGASGPRQGGAGFYGGELRHVGVASLGIEITHPGQRSILACLLV